MGGECDRTPAGDAGTRRTTRRTRVLSRRPPALARHATRSGIACRNPGTAGVIVLETPSRDGSEPFENVVHAARDVL